MMLDHRLRVLLVDGDPATSAHHRVTLENVGFTVRHVLLPSEALLMFGEFSPDLLIIDYHMPEMTGAQFAAHVRASEAGTIPGILLITADARPAMVVDALQQGVTSFMRQPLDQTVFPWVCLSLAKNARAIKDAVAQQQALVQEAHFHQRALDAHAIVSEADLQGNITYINDKFCQLSGYSRDELLGQNHRLLKSGVHPDAFYQEMWRTIARGKVWHGDICNRNKSGGFYWVSSTIMPFLDVQGKPYRYVSIRTDITELKLQQAQLIAAHGEANRANRSKSEFLSSMSHELRTPMNAILGFGQLLEIDDTLNEEQMENVRAILKGGRHLLILINEVLDLAKIESGRLFLSLEPVEVCLVVKECLELVVTLASQRNITISCSGLQNAAVHADRTRFKQVLLNLLSNAIKYNRDGGRVEVCVQAEGEKRLRILVKDTGDGVPAHRLAELFQPFNRLDAESSDVEGTGIGLTITRRLVEMMGGSVDVESKVGEGSTFWVDLPLAQITASSGETDVSMIADNTLPAHDGEEYTVLYIEDNPINTKLVTQILGLRKHVQLLNAHTPEFGIALALSRHPHLILLDINMPGMNGYQVLEILKADARLQHIPVIALTANAMPHDIERGMAAGFADYLTKPLDVGVFLQTIDRFIQLHAESHT